MSAPFDQIVGSVALAYSAYLAFASSRSNSASSFTSSDSSASWAPTSMLSADMILSISRFSSIVNCRRSLPISTVDEGSTKIVAPVWDTS